MTHYKKLRNPDFLGSWDFQPKQEIVLTIKSVKNEMVTGADGKKEDCTVVHFVESNVDGIKIKPMILNVTNAKMIHKVHKTPYIEEWVGKCIQLRVESVKAFGEVVDAVRVRNILPRNVILKVNEPINCEDCKNEIVVDERYPDLTPAKIATGTMKKYGKILCPDCAAKAKTPEEEAATMPNPLGGENNG